MKEAYVRALLAGYQGVLRPMLFRFDPEDIHEYMIRALSLLPTPVVSLVEALCGKPAQPVRLAGINFPGRVGVAAGLDKDGLAAASWRGFGFGFTELGTVTPRPQPGNDRPRVFRAKASKGLINRMGFNNHGSAALASRLQNLGVSRGNSALGIPIGVSIGKNKTTAQEQAVDDYLAAFADLEGLCDYIAVNVSSPNTPNLRDLQTETELGRIVTALTDAARAANSGNPTPVFVKLAPELSPAQADGLAKTCESSGAAGLIATNTTLSRHGLASGDQFLAAEAGGLSGAPLSSKSLGFVEHLCAHTALPVIGSGGVMTPADAQRLFDAGAQLVQVFTGFIYNGPALVRGINQLSKADRLPTATL